MSDPLPWNLAFSAAEGVSVRSEYDGASGLLQVTLSNNSEVVSSRPQEVRLSAPLDLAADDGWAWLHGRSSSSEALVRVFGDIPEEEYSGDYVRALEGGRTYLSQEVLALTLPSQPSPSLIVGSMRMDRISLDIEIVVDEDEDGISALALVFGVDGVELAPGQFLALPPVLVIDGRDPQAMMERYADEVTAEMVACVPARVPTGWRSRGQTEAAFIAELDTLARAGFCGESFEVEAGIAPTEVSAPGKKALADRIRTAGYRPGLALAPFLLPEDSAALRESPGLALKTRKGGALLINTPQGRCAVLDCTNPAAESWLREAIGTIIKEWGYGQLRLDSLNAAVRPASEVAYTTAGTTGLANLRRGLEIIREAAGDGTLILAGDCSFGPAIGLVDAMQVGPTTTALWVDGLNPSARRASSIVLQRNWMNGRWWANDPGSLVAGDPLSEVEAQFLATTIALSGGTVCGEAPDDYPAALIPPAGIAARAIDAGDGPVPSEWRVDLGEGRALVGILNWEEESRWVVVAEYLRPGEVAFDAWAGRILGKGDVLLRPHEGTLWQVAAPGQSPRVIGDTGHLNYDGLYQRQVSGRVQVRNDRKEARTIGIEARGRLFEANLAPGEMQWFD